MAAPEAGERGGCDTPVLTRELHPAFLGLAGLDPSAATPKLDGLSLAANEPPVPT